MPDDFFQAYFGQDPSIPHGTRGAYCAAAKAYDARSGDYEVDADSRIKSQHPIDAGVQLAVFVQQGELRSSPTTGNTILDLDSIGTDRFESEVDGAIRNSNPIARYLKEKSIEILDIAVEYDEAVGAIKLEVSYRNLLTLEESIARASLRRT